MPCESPLVPLILAPIERTEVQSVPTPPDHLDNMATSEKDLKIPRSESSTVFK